MPNDEQTWDGRTSSLGWVLQRASARVERAMEQRLSRHGMNIRQFAVMMTILEQGGLSQSEIGARFTMPAYAISRAIDMLEEAGLAERRPHPTSRRRLTIHPTEKGKALGAELVAIVHEVNDSFAAPLSPQERARLLALLGRLI